MDQVLSDQVRVLVGGLGGELRLVSFAGVHAFSPSCWAWSVLGIVNHQVVARCELAKFAGGVEGRRERAGGSLQREQEATVAEFGRDNDAGGLAGVGSRVGGG
jgi:hypothetical protein